MAQSYQVDIVTKVVGASKVAQLEKSLKKLDHNSAKVSKAAGQMSGSLKRASGQLASTGGSARRASAGVKAFGAATVGATGTLRAFGAALASYLGPIAAVAAAVAGLAKSFQIAGEREADARALANGLQKIGAEKGALDSLQASADKLGKTTLFNQEDFTQGYKLLTSFRNIGLSSYEEVSTAAADMATVIGGDVNSSLLQLAKALENPAVGLSYLSRSGTTFTDSQKEMIKQLQESGDMLGAQAEIMKVVQQQYAGAAVAAGKSGLAGAFDSMMETLRDAGEVIGRALEPLAVGAMNAITAAVQKMGDVWNQLKVKVFPGLVSALKPVYENFKAIVEQINWEGLITMVGVGLVGAFKALEFALKPVLWLINNMLKGLRALIESPAGRVIGAAFNKVAKSIDNANQKAGELKGKTEATVKPVSDLKQTLELTQLPLQNAAGKAGELKTALEGSNPPAQGIVEKAGFISEALSGASANGLNLADQLKKMRTEAEGVKKETTGVKEQVKETVPPAQKNVEILGDSAKQIEIIKEKQAQARLETERTVEAQEKHTTAAAAGGREVLILAEGEGSAAVYANQLANYQEMANAAISQGKAEAAGLASNLQAAASAAAGIGGGGGGQMFGGVLGGGSGSTTSKTYAVADYYKMNDKGQIVETTGEERSRQKNQQQLQFMNAHMRMVQAHDQSTRGTMVGPPGSMGFENEMRNPDMKIMLARQAQTYVNQMREQQAMHIAAMGRRYAEGGYVDQPTNALIGEGGEPEYVIPQSKLSATMENYRAGKRGADMIPESANVSIEYKGSTVDMGGTSYINKGDVNGIVSQAVNATLTTLKKSPKARLEAGIR